MRIDDPSERILVELLDAGVELHHTERCLHGRTLHVLGLARLIEAKAAVAALGDRMALPILIATLEATKKAR